MNITHEIVDAVRPCDYKFVTDDDPNRYIVGVGAVGRGHGALAVSMPAYVSATAPVYDPNWVSKIKKHLAVFGVGEVTNTMADMFLWAAGPGDNTYKDTTGPGGLPYDPIAYGDAIFDRNLITVALKLMLVCGAKPVTSDLVPVAEGLLKGVFLLRLRSGPVKALLAPMQNTVSTYKYPGTSRLDATAVFTASRWGTFGPS